MTDTAPDDLKDWSLHCFCLGARQTPHNIVCADGNGRLLLLAQNGIDRSALDQADFAALETRLILLETFGLVERNRNTIRTTFPILGPDQTNVLRQAARALAEHHADRFIELAEVARADLSAEGLAGSAEATIFGHALDGLAWHHLAAQQRLPDTALSLDRPFWNGAFWASYPRPTESGGTNELPTENASLVMVWVDANVDALNAIAADPATARALQALQPDALSLTIGTHAVPVLGGTLAGPACAAIGRLAAGAIIEGVDDLAGQFPEIAPQTLTVIFGHDLIWAVAEVLRARSGFRPLAEVSPHEAIFVRPRA